MADQKYTPVGHEIWRWFASARWRPLTNDAKLLWLFFYTSRAAKTSVPGLWPGTVYGMAESGLSPNDAHNTLDRMIEHNLAQFDADNQLVRLTELPDGLDRAHTEQAIWGWWGRFKTLPAVPLRNAHIPLLWSLVQGGKYNDKMIGAWKQTFGTVVIPAHLPAFLPLSSSDTSTTSQPSLFPVTPDLSNQINNSGARGLPSPYGTRSGEGSEIWSTGADSDPGHLDAGENAIGRPQLRLVPAPSGGPEVATDIPGNRLAEDAQDAAIRVRDEHVAEQRRALREAASAAGLTFFIDSPTPTAKATTDGPDPTDKPH